MVQAGVGPQVVQRPQGTCVHVRRTGHDASDPRRPGSAGAHRAGLERDHERRAIESPRADGLGGVAQCQHLGVGRGVPGGFPLVVPAGDDLAFEDDHRTDRYLAGGSGQAGLVEGDAHERLVVHDGDDRCGTRHTRPRAWRPGDLRHPGGSAESCCLPALTRFTGPGRTGPDRHTRRRVCIETIPTAHVLCTGALHPSEERPVALRPESAPGAGPGGMRERTNRHAWKACVAPVTVGSNPTPSAGGGPRHASERVAGPL